MLLLPRRGHGAVGQVGRGRANPSAGEAPEEFAVASSGLRVKDLCPLSASSRQDPRVFFMVLSLKHSTVAGSGADVVYTVWGFPAHSALLSGPCVALLILFIKVVYSFSQM